MATIDLKKIFEIPVELDRRSTDALIKAIKDNYKDEFDYIKFIHSVNTLIAMDINEETAYKSAYTTAKTMGFTKEKFRKSLKEYEIVLKKQRESFAEALKRNRTEKLTGTDKKNDALKKKLADNEAKIEKLKAENELIKEKIDGSKERLKKEREKLETITKNFVSSYEHFELKLKNDLEKFENYI